MEVFYVVFISLFGRGKQNTLYIADRNLLELLIAQFCMMFDLISISNRIHIIDEIDNSITLIYHSKLTFNL